MAKKRGNNEGSIYQRANGTWRAQIALDGRRLSYTGKTRKDCQEWLKKTIGQIDDGMTFASTQIGLDEFLSRWLTSTKHAMRQRTWTQYDQIIRNYIAPSLGKQKVKDIRPDQIQRVYDQLIEKAVGIPTIRKVHTVLQSALNYALKLGMVRRNPACLTIPPREPEKEMLILEEAQISILLIATKDSRFEALFQVAITTGMRQMELLGLKWTDLDWIKRTIKVERQLIRPDGNTVPKYAPTKTKFGRRVVDLGVQTIEILRKHLERQQNERLTAGDRWVENGLIFTTRFGTPIHPRNLLREFKTLLKKTGVPPIRFHDLRHTAASLMLNHGVPVIVASRRLGHAKPSITLDIYGHLIPSMQAEAAQLLDELVTPVEIQRLHPVAPEFVPPATQES